MCDSFASIYSDIEKTAQSIFVLQNLQSWRQCRENTQNYNWNNWNKDMTKNILEKSLISWYFRILTLDSIDSIRTILLSGSGQQSYLIFQTHSAIIFRSPNDFTPKVCDLLCVCAWPVATPPWFCFFTQSLNTRSQWITTHWLLPYSSSHSVFLILGRPHQLWCTLWHLKH